MSGVKRHSELTQIIRNEPLQHSLLDPAVKYIVLLMFLLDLNPSATQSLAASLELNDMKSK